MVLYVMIPGAIKVLLWSANSWDSLPMVGQRKLIFICDGSYEHVNFWYCILYIQVQLQSIHFSATPVSLQC